MAHKFFRGFKKDCESYAQDYREQLDLESHAPLCSKILATHLDIPVHPLSTHDSIPLEIKNYWKNDENSKFSGMIINDGNYKEIIHNDYHHPRRQNSNISHELAHIIMGHPLTAPFKANGERNFDKNIEEEAKWLGATLLLPKKSLIRIILESMLDHEIQEKYNISMSLFNFRCQVTDAFRAAKNTRNKYGVRT